MLDVAGLGGQCHGRVTVNALGLLLILWGRRAGERCAYRGPAACICSLHAAISVWPRVTSCSHCRLVSPGAITAFSAGYVKIRWALWSELVIGGVTAFQAGLLFLMSTTSNIWLCYGAYILFRGSYQFLVPLAM